MAPHSYGWHDCLANQLSPILNTFPTSNPLRQTSKGALGTIEEFDYGSLWHSGTTLRYRGLEFKHVGVRVQTINQEERLAFRLFPHRQLISRIAEKLKKLQYHKTVVLNEFNFHITKCGWLARFMDTQAPVLFLYWASSQRLFTVWQINILDMFCPAIKPEL